MSEQLPSEGGEKRQKLYFESPPSHAAIDYSQATHDRYNRRQV